MAIRRLLWSPLLLYLYYKHATPPESGTESRNSISVTICYNDFKHATPAGVGD